MILVKELRDLLAERGEGEEVRIAIKLAANGELHAPVERLETRFALGGRRYTLVRGRETP